MPVPATVLAGFRYRCILKLNISFSQKMPFMETSASSRAANTETGANSTATRSPILSDVSCDALQRASSNRCLHSLCSVDVTETVVSVDVTVASASVSMTSDVAWFDRMASLSPFLMTSNTFSSSSTTGSYNGIGRIDVWSTHDVAVV